MAKFKQVRYTDSGIHEYIWQCVKMPHDKNPKQHVPGNVRYYHGLLEGTKQRWDDPPQVSDDPIEYKNPGQDYNCRCIARPFLRLKE
jgi:uncharacterized protein with gpF-like domain